MNKGKKPAGDKVRVARKKAPVTKITARTPEGSVKSQVKSWLRERGWYYFMPVQTGYGARGLDFYICKPDGRFVACEAKRKGGHAQGFQRKLVRDIQRRGGHAFIFDSAAEFQLRISFVTI